MSRTDRTGRTDQPAGGRPEVTGNTRVRLHPLASRPDRDEWLVGRVPTREVVALPPVGMRAIDLLGRGLTVTEVATRLRGDAGDEVDLVEFVTELVDLGFVAEVDAVPVRLPAPRPATFGWLRPEHVGFVLHPAVPAVLALLLTAAVAAVARQPRLLPGYHALVWSDHGSLVIGLGAGAGWALTLLHELAHLVVARATGVPARIGLGTRLQFLVAQTDISGIELAPRRHRITAYLAGLGIDLSVAAVGVLLLAASPPTGLAHRILSALLLLVLLSVPFEFMVFMRTDVYFVLADVTGCRDLYHDGLGYARYLCRRITGRWTRRPTPPDPSRRLPAHERRAVRLYTVVLVAGTAGCLVALAALAVPADATLLYRAVAHLGPGQPALTNLDAATVLVVLGGTQIVWAATRWRNRRSRRGGRPPALPAGG